MSATASTAIHPSKTLKDLPLRQRKFIRAYLDTPNCTQAAIKAGYSERNADKIGWQVLGITRPVLTPLLEAQEKQLAERSGVTKDRWLKEVARLAFTDIRALFDEQGNVRDISTLSLDEAAALVSFERNTLFVGHGDERKGVGFATKFKLADKLKALELFGKATGYYVERVEVEEKGPLAKLATAVLLKMQQELERQVVQVERRPAPIEIGTEKP